MLNSSLCDYSDAYILFQRTITIARVQKPDNVGREVVFKSCASFSDWISGMNNTQIYNAKNIDVVTLKDNIIEYSDIYSKASGSLWQ